MRTLLVGWFSFASMGATAGDLIARDVAIDWLREAGRRQIDIAQLPMFGKGVDWREVDPADYAELVFVCGPFGNGPPITDLLERFSDTRLIGLDVAMLAPLEEWQPFDILFERDSSRISRPDIVFASPPLRTTVIGRVLAHRQLEYGERSLHGRVDGVIADYLAEADHATVDIDTRLDERNAGGRTAAAIETLISRVDVVVTTRLHGLVLALKSGVPAVAVDPIAGGAKVQRQAEAIGWPVILAAEDLTVQRLGEAVRHCLSPAGSTAVVRSQLRAREQVAAIRHDFVASARASDSEH
jgi:hypothetical protein